MVIGQQQLVEGKLRHLGGWRKQDADTRDETYKLKLHPTIFQATLLPASVDLRLTCPPIEDQGSLGSCTANMLAALVEANELRKASITSDQVRLGEVSDTLTQAMVTISNVKTYKNGNISYSTKITHQPVPPDQTSVPRKFINVSRLFQYYATRKIEGTISEDSGATIRDTLKAGNKYGVVDEMMWPYDISKFTENPPANVWESAIGHKITSYHSIANGDLVTMKTLISQGYLVGFGFLVHSYFLSGEMAKTAVLHRPKSSETLQGGHAVCLCGYDDAKKAFLVRNSWGKNWGQSGYFWMDYDYVADANLANDFWVVQSSPI